MKRIITFLTVIAIAITVAPFNKVYAATFTPPTDSLVRLKIHPNPVTTDYITISFPSDVNTENATVFMYDELGRLILSHSFPSDGRIPLVGITKGPLRGAVYYIRVITADGNQYVGPFVRARN